MTHPGVLVFAQVIDGVDGIVLELWELLDEKLDIVRRKTLQ